MKSLVLNSCAALVSLVVLNACNPMQAARVSQRDFANPAQAKPAATPKADESETPATITCSPEILKEFESMGASCTSTAEADVAKCMEAQTAFEKAHPNLKCSGKLSDGTQVTISSKDSSKGAPSAPAPSGQTTAPAPADSNEAPAASAPDQSAATETPDETPENLEYAFGSNIQVVRDCSPEFLKAYDGAQQFCSVDFDIMTKSIAQNCARVAKNFVNQFGGQTCLAPSTGEAVGETLKSKTIENLGNHASFQLATHPNLK